MSSLTATELTGPDVSAKLFRHWPESGGHATRVVEPAAAHADPEGQTLAAVIDHLADTLAASDGLLALSGTAGTRLLFASRGCEARWPELRRPFIDVRAARGPVRTTALDWFEDMERGETWLLLRLPVRRMQSEWATLALRFDRLPDERKEALERGVEAIRPLLAGFLRLWRLHGVSAKRAEALAGALDQCDFGVIFLDHEARLIFANAGASALLDCGEAIRRQNGSIRAKHLGDALRLQVAIDYVLTGDDQARADCATVVAVQRSDGKRPLLVSIAAPRGGDHGGELAAIVSVFDPDRDLRPLMKPACALYGLSPAETRLACLLAHGEPLDAAATALRIRGHTARGYLKQIFIKTDTKRQADLVRLLISSAIRAAGAPHFDIV